MEWRDEGVQISRTVWKATDSACTSVMTLLNNRGDYRGTRQIWAQAEKVVHGCILQNVYLQVVLSQFSMELRVH